MARREGPVRSVDGAIEVGHGLGRIGSQRRPGDGGHRFGSDSPASRFSRPGPPEAPGLGARGGLLARANSGLSAVAALPTVFAVDDIDRLVELLAGALEALAPIAQMPQHPFPAGDRVAPA